MGGSSEFQILRTLYVMSQPHFTSDLPPKGLKMTLRVFSSKITFQILTPIFRFRGIPGTPNFFFSEFFFRNLNNSAIFYPITLNLGLKWPENDFSDNVGSRNCDFPRFWTFSNFFLKKMEFFWKKNSKMSENGGNRNFCFQHFLQNRFLVILSPNWG